MKTLKKPFVAWVLCILLVLASSFFSVSVKLGAKCHAVSDGLYDGVYGETPIASYLRTVTVSADTLCEIASRCGIDTQDASYASKMLANLLGKYETDARWLFYNYEDLNKQLGTLLTALEQESLSSRDREAVEQCRSDLEAARSAVASSSYNESVREFRRKYERFPASFFITFGAVDLPQYFA